PTVRTVRLAGSVSTGGWSRGGEGAGAAVEVVPRNSGRSGFPSGPARGCDNCLAFCSVTTTSPGTTVSSGPVDLRVCAQLSPGRRQLQVEVKAFRYWKAVGSPVYNRPLSETA